MIDVIQNDICYRYHYNYKKYIYNICKYNIYIIYNIRNYTNKKEV